MLVAGGGGLGILVGDVGWLAVLIARGRWLGILGLVLAIFRGVLGWVGGSVPIIVLVLVEQLEGLGGLGEDAEGFGATYLNGVGVALVSQNVGDAVDGGFEPDGITGGSPGND